MLLEKLFNALECDCIPINEGGLIGCELEASSEARVNVCTHVERFHENLVGCHHCVSSQSDQNSSQMRSSEVAISAAQYTQTSCWGDPVSLPHGQVFVGPSYGLLLLMFMCVLYPMGGTELKGF